jgi:UDP-N-acetylmuramate dehydrogenase
LKRFLAFPEQLVSDLIVFVEVYDILDDTWRILENKVCGFRYRDSLFKTEKKNRYIITDVVFRLSKLPPIVPEYPGVREELKEQDSTNSTLQEIRDAITTIRWRKLPDPSTIPNCGSFFKNPFVAIEKALELQDTYPDMPQFPEVTGLIKIPAGWLIEKCGWKGKTLGHVGVYEGNALVLVNRGGATFNELMELKDKIIEDVNLKFGITLEVEPNIVM